MFLKYLLKPVAELFRPAAFPNHKDFRANAAFARSGQAYLKSGDQFRFFTHALCCHKFAEGRLPAKATVGERATCPRPQEGQEYRDLTRFPDGLNIPVCSGTCWEKISIATASRSKSEREGWESYISRTMSNWNAKLP